MRTRFERAGKLMPCAEVITLEAEPELQVEFRDWPRIEPGIYLGYVRHAKVYRDPGYRRWQCRVLFDLLDSGGGLIRRYVPLWLNLGRGEKPKVSRRGDYLREWIKANDGNPPRKYERCSPKIFIKRMARVEVGDTKSEMPTSKIARVLSWETAKK